MSDQDYGDDLVELGLLRARVRELEAHPMMRLEVSTHDVQPPKPGEVVVVQCHCGDAYVPGEGHVHRDDACRSEPRPDCGFVHELEAQLKWERECNARHVKGMEDTQAFLRELRSERDRALDTVAWQSLQLDEALARAERAEEAWKASQREAEALGRMLAAQGMGVG